MPDQPIEMVKVLSEMKSIFYINPGKTWNYVPPGDSISLISIVSVSR